VCLKKLVIHQSTVNASAPPNVYSILLQSIHPRLLSCICVFFLFTAMHVKSLAFCVWEWRRYTQYNTAWMHLLFMGEKCFRKITRRSKIYALSIKILISTFKYLVLSHQFQYFCNHLEQFWFMRFPLEYFTWLATQGKNSKMPGLSCITKNIFKSSGKRKKFSRSILISF